MNTDIKLCYFGGSGGFIVLHLLLLSGKFFCCFQDDTLRLEQIIDRQWNIPEPRLWKASEYWPDNHKTFEGKTHLRKVYFFNNPQISEIAEFEGVTYLLYLDADAQLEMARYKHAYMFMPNSTNLPSWVSYYRSQLQSWNTYYNNIRDNSWPRCTGPAGFRNLPSHIQQELLHNPWTARHLDIKRYPVDHHNNDLDNTDMKFKWHQSQYTILSNGAKVRSEVGGFWNHADVTIKLTDLLNDSRVLEAITDVSWNTSQISLRNRWAALHPMSLLQDIGIHVSVQLDEF